MYIKIETHAIVKHGEHLRYGTMKAYWSIRTFTTYFIKKKIGRRRWTKQSDTWQKTEHQHIKPLHKKLYMWNIPENNTISKSITE